MNNKKELLLVGDCHGKFKLLDRIARQNSNSELLVIGDVGVGFGKEKYNFRDNTKFFLGNHDNPSYRNHPNCIGTYGTWNDLFFVSGADSIDKHMRTEGVDWWRNEELSNEEMDAAFDLYKQTKPKTIITHEAPFHIHKILSEVARVRNPNTKDWGEPKGNRTAFLFDRMYQYHRPKNWIFAHWHSNLSFSANGTQFRCLDELQVFSLDNL